MKGRLLVVILMIVIVIAGTASWFILNRQDPPLEDLILSEPIHSIFYAPQYVALHKNFFTYEGLNIRLQVAQGADQGAAALLSGSAQVALFGPEQAIYATDQGDPLLIAFAMLTERDGSFLVGRTAEPEFSWSSLAGKTIVGGRKGGMPEMVLEWILKENEVLPFQDVKIIQDISLSATAQAFREGTGDYAQLWEPSATILEQAGAGQIVASLGKESGTLPYTVFHATAEYVKDHPKTLQKFTNAIYRAQLWMKSHSAEEIAKAIAPSFPDADITSIASVVQRYQKLVVWADDPTLRPELFDHLQEIMTAAGELTTKVNYETIVNTAFAEKTIKTIK